MDNRRAFLDMIAKAEGTSTHQLTQCDGYDVIVTGLHPDGTYWPEVFTDFSTHPFSNGRSAKHVSGNLYSTASGRYQFMLRDWAHYRDQLGLTDFSRQAQDLWALQLIRERHALPLIDAGDIVNAIKAVSNLWASLPGNAYAQPVRAFDYLVAAYKGAGGSVA